MTVDEAIRLLSERKRNLRRTELESILSDLGFRVRAGRKGSHRTFTHLGLSDFFGANFDGGHGTDAQIKPAYVGNVISVIRKYAVELRALRGES